MIEVYIADPDAMLDFGRALSAKLRAGDIVAIDGLLGAGKTVLCRGILLGFGHLGDVTSPTYTIVHRYDPPEVSIAVAHIDLYRIESADEIEELGMFDSNAVLLVEWAERYPRLSEMAQIRILIEIDDQGGRRLQYFERETHRGTV